MVSILPGARTPFDLIGQAIGQNISGVLPGAIQQGFQRQTGLNAIDQLQTQIQEAGGDLSKILPALAKAYTLNPNLERSGIGSTFLSQAQRSRGTEDFPAGEMPKQPVQPAEATEEGQTPQQIPVTVKDLVPARISLIKNPTGIGQFQLPYGPEEIAAIRQESRKRGYLPEQEERFVQDALEFNKIAEQRRNIEVANYQQEQQERRDTLENQRLFENYLKEHSPEFTNNPDELQLALKASEGFQDVPSFAERNEKVKASLRPYQQSKKALQKVLQRPLFGYTDAQRDLARTRAQTMVNKGQKDQLRLMIAKGGQGEVEEADLLNPLPKDIENRLKTLPKFVNPLDKVTSIDPESKEYNSQLQKGNELLSKQKTETIDYLSKAIVPGTYDKPGTNLLLTRKFLMDKGMSWDDAGQLIEEAINKGRIHLDQHQQIDFQKLGIPPLTGDTYFETVMNNVMFPITGKE